MKAIRIDEAGEPEVMRLVEIETPQPAEGQILVRNTAVGVNFLDTRMRRGDYPLPLPGGIGMEGVGEVIALGAGVTNLSVGQRVAYNSLRPGAYAEGFLVDAGRAVPIPEGIDDQAVAGAYSKAMTACMLATMSYPVGSGETALVWSAAGGVGQFVVQFARSRGARVIAVVGQDAKVEYARACGADEVLVSSREDVAARARELTGGEGVRVVYDAVGRDAFRASLDALGRRGMYVGYGSASGHPDPFPFYDLTAKGSIYVTRAVLADYAPSAAEHRALGAATLDALASGAVKAAPPRLYPLADAPQAHRDIASRSTTGSLVLIP